MYIRSKLVRGRKFHYLVRSERVGNRVKQTVVAYLGAYDCVEDAYMNAVGAKRRAKLARLRDCADIANDYVAAQLAAQYKHDRHDSIAPASAIRIMLPHLHDLRI